MLKSVCLLFFVSLVYQVSSQITPEKDELTGFYGKRFQFSLGTGGNVNLFSYLVNKSERSFRKTDNYTELYKKSSKGLFNYSFHATLGYQITERLGLSVDFNYLHGNALSFRNSNAKSPSTYDVRFEYESFRFMPRLEISSRNSNSPSGLTYILGLGIEFNRGISKTYAMNKYKPTFTNYGYYTYTKSFEYAHLYFNKKPQIGIGGLFGVEYRIPIAKWAAINLGAYTHLTLAPHLIFSSIEYEGDDEKRTRLMAKSRFQNLFSLRTGLVILL